VKKKQCKRKNEEVYEAENKEYDCYILLYKILIFNYIKHFVKSQYYFSNNFIFCILTIIKKKFFSVAN